MKIKDIEYPSRWSNKVNDNIDVFVTLENDRSYCVTIASIGWINEQVMKNGYLPASVDIIISEFSDQNIEKALKNYADGDAYWLRLYSVSSGDEIPK